MAKRSVQSQSTPEDILAGHQPAVIALAETLRQLIRDTVPIASEAAYPGWRGIGYTHPQSGYFCAIFPRQESVSLGFEFGVLLPDPAGLLTGSGRQLRYLELRPGEAIPAEEIQQLIRAALDLPASRAARLQMIQAMKQEGC